MVKHYELMGAIIIQNTTLGATTIQTTTGEFSKGPLIQNLRCKMYLGMDTSERKREKEKAEELNLNKSTGYCGLAANIWVSCL